MEKFRIFKITFLSVATGITVGHFIDGLFDNKLSSSFVIGRLFLKSLVVGIAVGLGLGLLNMVFKLLKFKKP